MRTPRWRDVPAAPEVGAGRASHVAGVVAPLVAAGFLAALGLTVPAVIVLVVGLVLAALSWAVPAVARGVATFVALVGRRAGQVVSTVLLGAFALLVLTPIAFLAKLTRRDPLRSAAPRGGTRWVDHPRGRMARRTFAAEPALRPAGRVRRVASAVPRVVGALAVLAVANYGLGWAWDEYVGGEERAVTAQVDGEHVTERAETDAFAGAEWATDHWGEVADLDYEFAPFVLSRVADVEGTTITSRNGIRRSYTGPGEGPEVWFFGGSAVWGEGQRDEHTIPSQVARAAEAAGSNVRVVNFGQPGYTSWQSALLLEQELAVRPAPDLVVFYDGADDVAVQLEGPSEDPTHYNADGAEVALTGRDSAADQARDLWEDYRQTSVLTRLADRLGGLFAVQPAAAADGALVGRVADLHARSVALAAHVAERAGVEAVFAWQAAEGVEGDDGAYRELAARGGPVDLSGVLDDVDEPVFVDGFLTNELGARIAAGALWAEIQPHL